MGPRSCAVLESAGEGVRDSIGSGSGDEQQERVSRAERGKAVSIRRRDGEHAGQSGGVGTDVEPSAFAAAERVAVARQREAAGRRERLPGVPVVSGHLADDDGAAGDVPGEEDCPVLAVRVREVRAAHDGLEQRAVGREIAANGPREQARIAVVDGKCRARRRGM